MSTGRRGAPKIHFFINSVSIDPEIPMVENLLQPTHLLIVLVVALFIFGPKKLPELGQGLGKGIRSFRDSMKAASEEPEKIETPVANSSETIK